MQDITITLDDEQMRSLRELARERGETPEKAAAKLLGRLLPSARSVQANAAPVFSSTLDLCGLVDDPSIPALSAEEMDRLLAAEALNPHDEQ